MVSPIKSLNISRSMSRTASDISMGQSPLMASPARSFFRTLHMALNKSSDVSLSLIFWYSDQIWLNVACPELEFAQEMSFQGGNCLFRVRISLIVSKISLLWRLDTLEVSFPLRYCCFSSNKNTSKSCGR